MCTGDAVSAGLIAWHRFCPSGHFCLCSSDPWPTGPSGFWVGWHCWRPARVSVWLTLQQGEESYWSRMVRFQTREFRGKASLSFSLSMPQEWDTIQMKITDIRYLCPSLTKAHEVISFEKNFELASILYSRIFWSFCWLVQSNGKSLRLLSCWKMMGDDVLGR